MAEDNKDNAEPEHPPVKEVSSRTMLIIILIFLLLLGLLIASPVWLRG